MTHGNSTLKCVSQVNFRSVATLIGHRLAITGVVAHTRYPMVITSSVDKSIRIWCLETFRENQRIDTAHRIQSISLSESRRFLFYYTKKRVGYVLFDTEKAPQFQRITFRDRLACTISIITTHCIRSLIPQLQVCVP